MDRFFMFAATALMNQEQGQSQEQGAGFVAVSSFGPSSFAVSTAAGPGLGKIPLHP